MKTHWMSIPLCLVIFYLCFMNTQSLPKVGISNFDKFVHTVMFLTVSLVVFFENTRYFKNKIPVSKIIYYSFFFPVIYGGLIEIGQEYFGIDHLALISRSGDWWDFVFNVVGAFAGLMVCLLINKRLT